MKESISIQYCFRNLAEDEKRKQIEVFESLAPGSATTDWSGTQMVLLEASADDPRIVEFLDQIQNLGVCIYERNFLQTGYGLSIDRSFDPSDLDSCHYLYACKANGAFLGELDYPLICDTHGVPALAGKPRQKARMFGTPEPLNPPFFVVRGDAKVKIEAAGFKGLVLHPVVFNRARNLAPEDQLWALWSDLILPPMKNLYRTNVGEMGYADEVTEKAQNAGPAKGFLTIPEIHYRREDLDVVGEFDVALIREPLKIGGTLCSHTMFSQRFRRFVIDELGFGFSGTPVLIDDDDIIPWEGPYPSKWSHLNRRPEWLEKLQAEVSKRRSENPG